MVFAGLSKGPWGWGPSRASVGTRSSAGLLPGTWLPQPPSSRRGLGGLSPLHRPARAASQASRARIKAAGVGGDLETLPHREPVPETSSPRDYHRQGLLSSLSSVFILPSSFFSFLSFLCVHSFLCCLPFPFPFLLTPLLLFHFFQSNFTHMHSLESTSFTRLVTKNNNPRPSSLIASFPRGSIVTTETHDSYLSVSKCHVCRASSGLRGITVTYSLPARQEEISVLYLPCQARARTHSLTRTHSTPVLSIQLLCYFA